VIFDAEYYRLYYQRNREKLRAYHRFYQNARYNRQRNLPATLTRTQLEKLIAIGEATYPGEELELDHMVSVKHGGGWTRANIHAIPRALNQLKKARLPNQAYMQLAIF